MPRLLLCVVPEIKLALLFGSYILYHLRQSAGTSAVADLWKLIKDAIIDGIQMQIPTKKLNDKDSLQYITPEIITLIKHRDRICNINKKKQRHLEWSTSGYK